MQTKPKILVKIENLERNVYCAQGATLLECLNQNKIEISQVCGGMASCGTCRVYLQGELQNSPLRNELEAEVAQDKHFADNERLACQLEVEGPLAIKIP